MTATLLSQIRNTVVVDVDSMDPTVAERHSANGTAKFADMTSNQAITFGQVTRPERADLVKQAIEYVLSKGTTRDSPTFASDVIDVATVLLAKAVYPYLTGNVHAQTSPSTAYSTPATVAHAKKLVSLFNDVAGIPKERACIKIPVSAESAVACAELKKEGIQTLGTCLFSLDQALAAHQAGCTYVAPYFNELRVHFEPSTWREFADPATEHPMSGVILTVLDAYKKIGSKTLVIPASIVTAKEATALASLRPHHLTISGAVLDQLAALPEVSAERLAPPPTPQYSEEAFATDYLTSSGAALKAALAADAESTRKLADALKLFDDCERQTKEFILALKV
ncbi:aldolase [Schizophyllum commune Loenen D]|nr:aldolase [Schizophyllum commune Loenen D]